MSHQEKEIKKQIMNQLGVDDESADTLINGYRRQHSGNVDQIKIIKDVKKTTVKILEALPEYSEHHVFFYELTYRNENRQPHDIDDGKLRIIENICGEKPVPAVSCLPSIYADDVDKWADAIYCATQSEFKSQVLSNGIDVYRNYVNDLSCNGHSIQRLADGLGARKFVVKFLEKNGDNEDIYNYIRDIAYDDWKKMGTKPFTLACSQLGGEEDLDGGRLVPMDNSHAEYMETYYPHRVIDEARKYAEDNSRKIPMLFMDALNQATAEEHVEPLKRQTDRLKTPGRIRLDKSLTAKKKHTSRVDQAENRLNIKEPFLDDKKEDSPVD